MSVSPHTISRSTSALTLPDFVIIGAMKAGSTSLARYLQAHAQVFMAPGKEIHYFDRNFTKGLEWYAQHFSGSSTKLARGEATPNYLYDREAMRRMASTTPDAKLIAILRNPVDRAYSHYWHERARGRETLEFEQALAAEQERVASRDSHARTHYSYFDQGLYVEQLTFVADIFPRSTSLVLLFDDFYSDPVTTFRKVCRFIDVREDVLPENLGKRYNEYVSFRSLAVRSLAHRLNSRPGVGHFMGRVLGRLNTRRLPYPPMSPDLKAKLVSRYRGANQALASWLGRDLAAWDR